MVQFSLLPAVNEPIMTVSPEDATRILYTYCSVPKPIWQSDPEQQWNYMEIDQFLELRK